MRLIDADALMKTLGITEMDCERCEWGEYGFCGRGRGFTDACTAIEAAPTIEPERKRGEWKDRGEDYMIRWICSECGRKDTHVYNFCPDCGADMRGGETDV